MKILLIEDADFAIDNIVATLEGVAEVILPPTFTSPWIPRSKRNLAHFPPFEEMEQFIRESDADIVLLDINLGATYYGWDLAPACKGKKVVCISMDECYPTKGSVSWTKKGDLYESNIKVKQEFIQFLKNL